jgi:hypothetical protein
VILSLLGAVSLAAPIIYAKMLSRDTAAQPERAPENIDPDESNLVAANPEPEQVENAGAESVIETANPSSFESE